MNLPFYVKLLYSILICVTQVLGVDFYLNSAGW